MKRTRSCSTVILSSQEKRAGQEDRDVPVYKKQRGLNIPAFNGGKSVAATSVSPERTKKQTGSNNGNGAKAPGSTSPSGQTKLPSPTAAPGAGCSQSMKHSKSDHSGLGSKRDHSSRDEESPLGKKFISKSQENLSSHKKGRHLSTVVESPRPRANAASIARAVAVKNKEAKDRDKTLSVFAKPKPAKPNAISNIRKASSTQSIDKTSQSAASLKSGSSKSSNSLAIKRAQSTQSICKDKFSKKRTSAPADVMAYNAELLANFEKEKKLLEVRISELAKIAESRKGEMEKYKYEIKHLKDQLSSSVQKEQIEVLQSQNKQLLDRLQELGFPAEQITDAEKLMLKFSSAARSHGSNSDICLPASASCDSLSTDCGAGQHVSMAASVPGAGDYSSKGMLLPTGGGGLDLGRSSSLSASEPGMSSLPDLCGTPDHPSVLSLDPANWDKQSNKSANSDGGLSEASVACLTERILQMEETNYSTTEELQATLQELGDLQDTVNELTEENTKLTDEKAVLLESLCTQTEKLENTRIQLEQLKYLLISGELPNKSDRDGHLLGLLKSAAEEREELMRKQTEWSNALESLESECREAHEAGENLREKYNLLEDANGVLKCEKAALELQLVEMKEAQTAEQFEVARLKALLEQEKKKVAELERERGAQENKTDLESLLDVARQDKAQAEQKVVEFTESLGLAQCDITRLKDALNSKELELTALRSSTKTQLADLQQRLAVSEKEKQEAQRKEEALRQHVEQLEGDCDRHLEDKKEFTNQLQQVESELRAVKQQKQIIEMELQEINSKHDVESEEWRQFQKDLQTAVVIANNFSQETQEKMEKLTQDNSLLQEHNAQLEAEVEKLQREFQLLRQSAVEESPTRKPSASSLLTNAEFKGKVLSSMGGVHHPHRPHPHTHMDSRSQSISVKSLIRSIEEHVKSGGASMHSSRSESRRSSASSDISLASLKDLVKSPASPMQTPDSPQSPTKDFSLRTAAANYFGKQTPTVERSPQQRLLLTPTGQGTLMMGVAGSAVSPEMGTRAEGSEGSKVTPQISSILKDRSTPRRNSTTVEADVAKKETPGKDPLASLAKLMKGSKRNALLKWCQLKTIQYANVDITNFSSSWNDGLAFCALLHSYVPEKIPYSELNFEDKRKNFTLAFTAGESIGIKSTLNISEMVSMERPDWQAVMGYVTNIYKHFEVDKA
ncbi:cytospin-a [Plakobranchus ocellatus]|uniref:Cytospin-a n=1 Tax=Plakobranchus ocellatus TaxID=259542 RepID=A0AAV4A2N4_9GAST|nr:cytospin-a [Plakobranchus ocellatus]